MSMKDEKIEKLIKEIDDLPELPHVAHKIISLALDDKVSNVELAKYVEYSPSLALKILKIINSPIYGFKSKINSLSQAIGLLGRKTIKNLALTVFIIDSVKRKVDNSYTIWENFIYCVSAGKRFAKRYKIDDNDIFLIFLIIHIPLILLTYLFPNDLIKVDKFYTLKKNKRIIKKYLNKVIKEWHFDKDLCLIVEKYYNFLSGDKKEIDNFIKTIYCSFKIANFLSLKGSSIEELKDQISLCEKLDLDELIEIVKNIVKDSNKIFELFEIPYEEKHYEELIYFYSKANKKITNILIENEKLIDELNNVSTLLSLALNYIPVGVVIFENDRLVMINVEAINILNISSNDFEKDLEIREFIKRFIKNDLINPDSEYLKVETKLKNGYPVELTYLAYQHLAPRKLFFMKSLLEEYKLKEEYSGLKETYINILKCAVDGIVILDLDFKITFANEKFYEIFKLDRRSNVFNRSFFYFFQLTEENKIKFKQKIIKLIRENIGEVLIELETIDKRIFFLTLTRFIKGRTLKGIQIFLRDITTYKNLQERTKKLEEINLKNKVAVELAGATAHKLNQPLTTLLFVKDILLKRTHDEELNKYLSKIEDSVNEISNIVKELSRITKYETRKYIEGTDILELK